MRSRVVVCVWFSGLVRSLQMASFGLFTANARRMTDPERCVNKKYDSYGIYIRQRRRLIVPLSYFGSLKLSYELAEKVASHGRSHDIDPPDGSWGYGRLACCCALSSPQFSDGATGLAKSKNGSGDKSIIPPFLIVGLPEDDRGWLVKAKDWWQNNAPSWAPGAAP